MITVRAVSELCAMMYCYGGAFQENKQNPTSSVPRSSSSRRICDITTATECNYVYRRLSGPSISQSTN